MQTILNEVIVDVFRKLKNATLMAYFEIINNQNEVDQQQYCVIYLNPIYKIFKQFNLHKKDWLEILLQQSYHTVDYPKKVNKSVYFYQNFNIFGLFFGSSFFL